MDCLAPLAIHDRALALLHHDHVHHGQDPSPQAPQAPQGPARPGGRGTSSGDVMLAYLSWRGQVLPLYGVANVEASPNLDRIALLTLTQLSTMIYRDKSVRSLLCEVTPAELAKQDRPILLNLRAVHCGYQGALHKGCQRVVQRAIRHQGDPQRLPRRKTNENSF